VSRGGEMLRIHVGLGARQGPDAVEREQLFGEANAIKTEAERLRQEAQQARAKGDEKKAQELSSLSATMMAQAEESRAYIEQQLKEGTLPDPTGTRLRNQTRQSGRRLLGVGLLPLTEQLASFFGAKSKSGLLVTDVKAGGLVERAGLKAGDCIILVNDEKVISVTDLSLAISRARDQVVFTVIRDRNEISLKTSMNTK
jgi:C-terminal processing protease CtpA/Prc